MTTQTIGHQKMRHFIANLLSSSRISSPLLFLGSFGIGKSCLAKEFAGSLLGASERCIAENHPDLQILRPLGKAAIHPIDEIRKLAIEVAKNPLEASLRVVIIEEAHRMGAPAANALLKTLEEPNSNTLFILITHKKEDLLPTIISRCRPCYFAPLAEEEIACFLQNKEIASLAHGSLGNAKRLVDGGFKRRAQLLSLLSSLDDYATLISSIQCLCADLEEAKKETLKTFRAPLLLEDLPAAARVAKELELEGRAQVAYLEEWEYLLREFAFQSKGGRVATEAYEGIEQFTRPATCLEAMCFQLEISARSS